MRPVARILAVALVMAPWAAATTGAWNGFLKRNFPGGHQGDHWVLALSPGTRLRLGAEDVLLALEAAEEFRQTPIPEDAWQALCAERGGPDGRRWLLLHRGRIAAEGPGLPEPDRLLALIRSSGFVPRAERRAAFLKDHPDQAEAWAEAFQEGLRLTSLRVRALALPQAVSRTLRTDLGLLINLPDAVGRDRAEELTRESRQALQRMVGLGMVGIPSFSARATEGHAGDPAAGFEAAAWRLMASADLVPGPAALIWFNAARLAGTDLPQRLAGFREPPGGRTLPELLFEGLRSHWMDADPAPLLGAVDPLLQARLPERGGNGWQGRRQDLIRLQLMRMASLQRLGRVEEALAAAGEARRLAGRTWGDWGQQGLVFLFLSDGGTRVPPGPLRDLLTAAAEPDPPGFQDDPPLRLVVLDPQLLPAFTRMLALPAFAPWDRQELALEIGSAARTRDLAARAGRRLRWAVLQGDQLLASGMAPPDGAALAAHLAQAGPSGLQRLCDWIGRNPDHLGARHLRFKKLLARMPDRRLEALLAEDALAALQPPLPRPEGWRPDPMLWQWAAQRALPLVERELQKWPSQNEELWLTWLGWADLHPGAPRLTLLLDRLAVWPPDLDLTRRVPARVHDVIAAEWRKGGRFEDLRDWFGKAWEGRTRSALPAPADDPDGTARKAEIEQRRRACQRLVDPLREALVALRRDAEVVALDQEVAVWLGEEGGNR